MMSTIRPCTLRRTRSSSAKPFPAQQLFILALCRICEPIAFTSIFPYIYQMILSFRITADEREIALYAGLVTSAFTLAEFSTSIVWGRLSDKVGRKPVLMIGLIGTALSMMVFGFASSLPMALLGRALGGFLNGNIGVLQTTVAEIVTVKDHQPRAYSVMPFVWCLGSIVGPAIGGLLAQPSKSYPDVFAKGTFFDRFPFLLPNLVCSAILVAGVAVGVLFMEETHELKRLRPDFGLECGRWIIDHLRETKDPQFNDKTGGVFGDESRSLLEDEPPPGYRTTEGSPCQPSSRADSPVVAPVDNLAKRAIVTRSAGVHKAFTKQVVLIIIAYGILAYHTMAFDQMFPVFLSSPSLHDSSSSPFKFTGGFSLSPKTIGFMLSMQGFYALVAQVFLFPLAIRLFGSLATFRTTVVLWPVLYFIVPYLIFLPANLQTAGIYFCLLWRITAQVLAYPSNAILLTNSAPSMLVLGVINGVAASTASLCRAFGPTVSGLIHSWGLRMGYGGLVWWVSGFICVLGALESLWLYETQEPIDDQDFEDEEIAACETLADPSFIDAATTTTDGPAKTVLKGHSMPLK